tara:strand:- start:2367 stop:3749 length:1383 start_codon:yes stop_codon:yes gene_type:complete
MFRGFLYSNSKDIVFFQKFFDAFFLLNIYFFTSNKNILDFNNLLTFFIFFIILNTSKIYQSYRVKKLYKILPKIFTISSSLTLINILLTQNNSNLSLVEIAKFFFISLSYITIHHYFLRSFLRLMRSKGFNTRNIIFFGNKKSLNNISNQIENYPSLGYRISHWFSPNIKDYNLKHQYKEESLVCRGGINELLKTIKGEKNIDKLYFSHHDSDEINFDEKLKILGDTCLPTTFLFDLNANLSMKKEFFGEFSGMNMWSPDYSKISQKIKRFFDLFFGSLAIFILFPFFILIAVLIKKTSHGPILYRQKRWGLNGKSFMIYKFRTMYLENKLDEKKIIQANRTDKRVTSFGKFLRRFSLDELPQLINVIRGEMSIVGPRPHAYQHNEYYRNLIPGYMQRHSRKPGMTGLAQVKGYRGETKEIELMKKRINYDIEYNNNWNLSKDFYILIQTFFIIFRCNAY